MGGQFRKQLTCCLRGVMSYLSVTVPRRVGDLDTYILRIVGLSDEEMRQVAGWVVSRGKMSVFLLHMRDNNVEWKRHMGTGLVKWDQQAFDTLPDGTVKIPLVASEAVGGLGRQGQPGDDPEAANDEDDHPIMMTHEEVQETIVQCSVKSVRQKLLEVVNGPELDESQPCPARDLPGVEALMFPDLFSDGYGTFRGLQRPGEKPHHHYLPWCQHLLRLNPRDWAKNKLLLAVMYRFHLDRRHTNRILACMSREQAEMSRADLRAAIQEANPNSPLFSSMTAYLSDIPGSDAMQHRRSEEAVATYRTILLMEQNHPALFVTQSSAEHLTPFTQAVLGTPDAPPPAGSDPPDLRTYDAGSDCEQRCRLVAEDPVASQMGAFELLWSCRKLLFEQVGAGDYTGAHEDQDRRIGEHSHFCVCLAGGNGVPRSEAMDPAADWHCKPYIATKKGQQHHVGFYKHWVTTAGTNGQAPEDYSKVFTRFKQEAYDDPCQHPAGYVRLNDPTSDTETVAQRKVRVNLEQALVQKHTCRRDRCLREDRRKTILNPVGKSVFVLGTVPEVAALHERQPDLAELERQLLALFRSIVPPDKLQFVKLHSVKVSRAGQLHVDATPTVNSFASSSPGPLKVSGLVLSYFPLKAQVYRLYCTGGHPHRPNPEYRLVRSARKTTTDGKHRLLGKVSREAAMPMMQNQYLSLSGGHGENLANTFGVNGDAQIIPSSSSNVECAVKCPHKAQGHHRAVQETTQRLLDRTDADQDALSAAAPVVLNAMLSMHHEMPVSLQQMARCLNSGSYNGDLADMSRDCTTLAIGGCAGYSGERRHVNVVFDSRGNPVLSSKSLPAQLYWSRLLYVCTSGIPEELIDVVMRYLNMFAFTASFEFDPGSSGGGDASFVGNAKYNAVRVVPNLNPDLENEECCQQCCHLYIPHTGDTEAVREAELMDGCGTWREAWLSFCLTEEELRERAEHWLPDAGPGHVALEHRLKPGPEIRRLRWGLPGAPQVPLGQLYVPTHARPIHPADTMLRAELVQQMQTRNDTGERLRDPKAGAGDSEIEHTDLSDIETYVPLQKAPRAPVSWGDSDSDSIDEFQLGQPPNADDLAVSLDGIPRPPPGFKFSGHGGHFTGNEDVGNATRCLADITAGRGGIEIEPANLRLFRSPDNRDQLDAGQRRVIDTVAGILDAGRQIELFVTGGAGCGKTFTVMMLCHHLRERWGLTIEEAANAIRVAAAFGLAARNACGSTLGSLFNLVTVCGKDGKKKIKPPSARAQQAMETELADLQVLILEEIGTIGSFLLTQLDVRLQQLRGNQLRWGGLHVVFMGDPDQLLPVKDTASWYPADRRTVGDKGPLELGSRVYHAVVDEGLRRQA